MLQSKKDKLTLSILSKLRKRGSPLANKSAAPEGGLMGEFDPEQEVGMPNASGQVDTISPLRRKRPKPEEDEVTYE